MGELTFEDQENEFGPAPSALATNDWSQKLISWGLVSSRQEAQYVLIGIAIVALIGAFFLYRSVSGGGAPPPPPFSESGAGGF